MRAITTLMAGAALAVAVGAGVGGPGTSTASAAPAKGSPACPASLRSVPGGARDAATRGFDDGLVGDGEAYRPGQVLLQLDPGTPQRAFDCVLRELGAVRIAGGRGKAGFARMPNLMLVQLPPARSVAGTSRLLRAGRYRALVDAAQPNWVTELRREPCPAEDADPPPFPNDPLFPWQWGLGPGNEAADTNRSFPGDIACDGVTPWPGIVSGGTTMKVGDAKETMRIPEAWPLLKRWYWFKRSVKVGIVDNSLVQHPDLVGSVLRGGSRVVTPAQITQHKLQVTATQGTFRIVTDGGNTTCDIAHDAAEADIRAALDRRVQIMCDVPAAEAPRFDVILVAGGEGEVGWTFGKESVTLDATLLSASPTTGAMVEAEITKKNQALGAQIAAGNLRVARVALPGNCPPDGLASECSFWMIGRKGTMLSEKISLDATRLLKFVGLGRGTGNAAVLRSGYYVVPIDAEPKTFVTGVRDSSPIVDTLQWTFQPADAAKVQGVRATGYVAERPDDPVWPGQIAGNTSANHGQTIAGIIGAQANNEMGMAGVLGPYVTPKLITAVTPLDTAGELVAIEYLAGRAGVPVVNWSLGGVTKPGTDPAREAELPDPQKEDPRPADLVQQKMAEYPRTLFVVAAGNTGTNLNHLAPRGGDPYVAGEIDYDPCAPKGMGITRPPGRGVDARDDQTKGGALSMLRMPDGTFDRGNILCVASMAPPKQESTDKLFKDLRLTYLSRFSSWGAGIVDVAAPGEGVIGTGLGGTYRAVDGTSFAAPLVAGVAGLINARYPGIDASLVKCAILSSATSAPLSTGSWMGTSRPFTGYALPVGTKWAEQKVLTVPGLVVATEALSAAAHLRNRTSGFLNGRRVGRGEGPTCVQERQYNDQRPDDPPRWGNTPTKPVPPPPAPPAPPAPAGP